jgi:tripartite-type tricarboxylate transporter receptor subunit TctC
MRSRPAGRASHRICNIDHAYDLSALPNCSGMTHAVSLDSVVGERRDLPRKNNSSWKKASVGCFPKSRSRGGERAKELAVKAALVTIALLTAIIPVSSPQAQEARSYPNRPITMVVPFGPGHVTDNSARLLAKALSEQIGQPIIIENKPGAAGVVGTEYAAHAKPDGYTILYGSSGPLASAPSMHKRLSYSPLGSFAPINGVGEAVLILVVNAARPYKTLPQFIDHLKRNPGQVTFASSGPGGSPHLAAQLFQTATGTTMTHVPYKNAATMYADLFAGVVDIVFDYSPTIRPHTDDGKVLALAVAGRERLVSFPNVPTFSELGYDVVMTGWSALMAPAGTPQDIVRKLSEAAVAASADPAVVRNREDNGSVGLEHLGPEKTHEFLVREMDKFKMLIEKSGATAE